jgi:uncharacterized protein (TIGR02145 family)
MMFKKSMNAVVLSTALVFFIVLLLTGMEVRAQETVTIGKQVWTSKNLDVDKFRNGDPIPQAQTAEEWRKAGDNKQPAWCYYDNDPINGRKYGKLYNWYAVNDQRGLAPAGFHIPTTLEWEDLVDFLGGIIDAAKKMKSTSGWHENNGSNESGFNGLSGGYRYCDFTISTFEKMGDHGYWWSTSDVNMSAEAWTRSINYGYGGVNRELKRKNSGCYVRCLKD